MQSSPAFCRKQATDQENMTFHTYGNEESPRLLLVDRPEEVAGRILNFEYLLLFLQPNKPQNDHEKDFYHAFDCHDAAHGFRPGT
jgi:hypothetical protein